MSLNRGGNRIHFAEAGRLTILARGISIKNSMSVFCVVKYTKQIMPDILVDDEVIINISSLPNIM